MCNTGVIGFNFLQLLISHHRKDSDPTGPVNPSHENSRFGESETRLSLDGCAGIYKTYELFFHGVNQSHRRSKSVERRMKQRGETHGRPDFNPRLALHLCFLLYSTKSL